MYLVVSAKIRLLIKAVTGFAQDREVYWKIKDTNTGVVIFQGNAGSGRIIEAKDNHNYNIAALNSDGTYVQVIPVNITAKAGQTIDVKAMVKDTQPPQPSSKCYAKGASSTPLFHSVRDSANVKQTTATKVISSTFQIACGAVTFAALDDYGNYATITPSNTQNATPESPASFYATAKDMQSALCSKVQESPCAQTCGGNVSLCGNNTALSGRVYNLANTAQVFEFSGGGFTHTCIDCGIYMVYFDSPNIIKVTSQGKGITKYGNYFEIYSNTTTHVRFEDTGIPGSASPEQYPYGGGGGGGGVLDTGGTVETAVTSFWDNIKAYAQTYKMYLIAGSGAYLLYAYSKSKFPFKQKRGGGGGTK